jgi:hypothetical protein
MRPLLTLIFLTCTVFAQAQDNLIYPDLLELKGKVKEVTIHSGDSISKVYIEYDYKRNVRVIQTYILFGRKKEKMINHEVVETFEEMHSPVRYQYNNGIYGLQKTDYTKGQIVLLPKYHDWEYAKKVKRSTDEKGRLSSITYFNENDSLLGETRITYTSDDGRASVIKYADGTGKLIGSQQVTRNEYGHVVQLKKKYGADGDDLYTMNVAYVYDAHGNIISYKAVDSNTGMGSSYVREITYME